MISVSKCKLFVVFVSICNASVQDMGFMLVVVILVLVYKLIISEVVVKFIDPKSSIQALLVCCDATPPTPCYSHCPGDQIE